MARRLGIQPFQQIVYDDGRSMVWLARQLDTTYTYVIQVANGYVAPSAKMRREMSRLLRRPIKDLFTSEALAAKYAVRRNSKAPLDPTEVGR